MADDCGSSAVHQSVDLSVYGLLTVYAQPSAEASATPSPAQTTTRRLLQRGGFTHSAVLNVAPWPPGPHRTVSGHAGNSTDVNATTALPPNSSGLVGMRIQGNGQDDTVMQIDAGSSAVGTASCLGCHSYGTSPGPSMSWEPCCWRAVSAAQRCIRLPTHIKYNVKACRVG